jgi:hypothetical protein
MEAQTHVRMFKKDKLLLQKFMRKKRIKSQAKALRLLLRK